MAKDPVNATHRRAILGGLRWWRPAVCERRGLGRWSPPGKRRLHRLRGRRLASLSAPTDGASALTGEGAASTRHDRVRWAIAVAGLLIVAAGMVAALIGISSLS